jgi:hypothetical protein
VITAFAAVSVVMIACAAFNTLEKKLLVVELVATTFVPNIFVAVTPVVDAFPKYACPLTVSAVADAFPRVEVPEVSVENVPVVNVGLGVREMVLVPEKLIFDPALKNEIGEL